MDHLEPTRRFDRIISWLMVVLTGLTPFVVVYALKRPNVAQTFFLEGVVLLAAAGWGVAWMLGLKPLPRRPGLPGVLICLLGLSALLAVAVSPTPLFSLKKILLPVCGGVFFLMLIALPERRRLLARLRAVLFGVGLLLALYGTLQHMGFEFLKYSEQVEKNHVMASIGHPNYLASMLGPVLFLALSFMLSRRKRTGRVLSALGIFLLLLCLMLARTRGVWLGLLFGFIAVGVMGLHHGARHHADRRWVGRLGAALLLMLAGLTVTYFLFQRTAHARIDLKERITADYEIKSRAYYWRAATDLARAKPILGQGYARFDPLFWTYALEQQKSGAGAFFYDVLPSISGRTPGHVHNEYLETLTEQGLFGLFALLAFLGFFLYFGYLAILAQPEARRAQQAIAVYGALITSLTDAAFAFPWRLPVSLIVFAIVLAWIYDEIEPQTAAAVEAPPAAAIGDAALNPAKA